MDFVRPTKSCSVRCHVIPTPKEISGLDADWLCLSDYSLSDCGQFPHAVSELLRQFHFSSSSSLSFSLRSDPELSAEEYRIEASESGIVLSSSTDRGACHGVETLKQLRRGNYIQQVRVHDWPSLPVRGFHTNLQTFCQIGAEDVLRLLDLFGKFKLNSYLIEYNSRFPFAKHAALRGVDSFTPEEVASFEARARQREVELIPLVQCIGHNAHIARVRGYEKLFEPAGENGVQAQLCPCNPGSFTLFTELASEIMAAHPHGRYLHIGGDETRSLGACPQCAAKVAERGKARLYLDYINQVIDWVVKQGRTPIIWDDMLSHFVDAVHELDHRVVIMYWDYWTTSLKSPIFVARLANGRGVVADQSYQQEGYAGLEEPERTVVQKFTRCLDVTELLSAPGVAEFAQRYLGPDLPRQFTGFPYLDFFQAEGFQVMGAPSTLGNAMDDIYGLPNYARFRKNIRAFAVKCQREKAAGMVTSSWYNFPAEMVDLGIIDTAQHAWTDVRQFE